MDTNTWKHLDTYIYIYRYQHYKIAYSFIYSLIHLFIHNQVWKLIYVGHSSATKNRCDILKEPLCSFKQAIIDCQSRNACATPCYNNGPWTDHNKFTGQLLELVIQMCSYYVQLETVINISYPWLGANGVMFHYVALEKLRSTGGYTCHHCLLLIHHRLLNRFLAPGRL